MKIETLKKLIELEFDKPVIEKDFSKIILKERIFKLIDLYEEDNSLTGGTNLTPPPISISSLFRKNKTLNNNGKDNN